LRKRDGLRGRGPAALVPLLPLLAIALVITLLLMT
jgi:hypothetical protein